MAEFFDIAAQFRTKDVADIRPLNLSGLPGVILEQPVDFAVATVVGVRGKVVSGCLVGVKGQHPGERRAAQDPLATTEAIAEEVGVPALPRHSRLRPQFLKRLVGAGGAEGAAILDLDKQEAQGLFGGAADEDQVGTLASRILGQAQRQNITDLVDRDEEAVPQRQPSVRHVLGFAAVGLDKSQPDQLASAGT